VRWVLISLVVVAVVLGAAFAFQRKLIYLPSDGPLPHDHDVTLRTADGLDLTAWYFPVDTPKATVLVAPGNAGNRSLRTPLARALNARGLNVLLLDYRGYGGNPGSPSEEGLALDVRAARDFAARQPGPLVYFGESLGSAVVAELATEHPPHAMILRSPFTDLAAAGQKHYPFLPVRLLLRDTFPVADHVQRTNAPVTVVYGERDSIIPPEQSRTVAERARARVVEVRGADHNDMALLDGPEVVDAVTRSIGNVSN
jgi:uncharacterized protein